MENLLQVLKEATLFILTTQLFRHLLPGKKYLPYENVILSMAVLSMLIVPILSVADADFPGEFGERVALLETENEMFSQHLEKLEEQETGLFHNNMADSIEVRVQKEAEAAGVRVKGVRLLEDGTVFISVSGQKHAEGAGQDSGISVEPVRPVGSTKARQEQFVLADGEALKGTAREDLKERFAAVIGIGQTQLEVVEVE
ncbi:stage III sporulation protein AF [Gallintestinimicrobium propionicum]|uniref:Stage III sporulation protein AF n=1 Tax=Gallintestinimicrobium propionicum TaxID=2981770 RepID=A0AAE3AX17_9FIRM|nr:stage III sporulation protein AF [Gallintestinimicrobium propionicum]MCC2167333.1 stage III sporulation protein AF [Gallintestinimicrobium propionicum]